MKTKVTLIPAVLVLIFAMLPQIFFWINGGSAGDYFVSNYDEPAFSAYVNALAAGKPRKTDQFLQTESQYESPYTIQFVPAYAIAVPIRLFGVSTSTGFIVLMGVMALLSYFALAWFLREATGNATIAPVGAFVVLCFGTAAAFQGELRHLITGSVLVDFFPFLRRYLPGLPFPLFFLFCASSLKAVLDPVPKKRLYSACAAGVAFAALVFSYFYLWTAAAAWLACFTAILVLFSKELRNRALAHAGIVGIFAVAALVPYFLMLSARTADLDAVQLLDKTRMPNLSSSVMIIGLIIAAGVIVARYRAGLRLADPICALCLSLAVTPVIVLNQQVVTGMSLQPVHYEIFIANYVVLTALVLFVFLLLRDRAAFLNAAGFARPLAYVVLATAAWGFLEASASASRASAAAALRDRSIPAIREIAERPASAGSVVLATNFVTADIVPTFASLRPLWNAHSFAAGGVGNAENKRLFYLFFYYSGFSSSDLSEALRTRSFEVTAAVFGSERALPSLASRAAPITDAEIQAETRNYDTFVSRLDAGAALSPAISYAIIPAAGDVDLRAIDRWYSRDQGVRKGLFIVYALTPRP